MNIRRPLRRAQAGFTLVELLVVFAVTVILILILLELFDLNDRLARVQTRIAETQQSLRIAQYDMVRLGRMAGSGGLPSIQPGRPLPTGIALEVRGNVTGANSRLIVGDATSPKVLDGTDVVTIRGVFTTDVFELNMGTRSFRRFDPLNPPGGATDASPSTTTSGEIHVCEYGPTGLNQPLATFYERIDEAIANPAKARKEALLIANVNNAGGQNSPFYTVVEFDPANSTKVSATCGAGVAGATLKYLSDATVLATAYRSLQRPAVGAMSPQMGIERPTARFVALLEEYRYYVREDRAVTGDATSDLVPVLSRARFYPGTNTPYQGDTANLRIDIASGIVDLQASLGIDTDGDGIVTELPNNRGADEWLGNLSGETPLVGRLAYLRLSTLARTERRDREYVAPVLVRSEDRVYGTGTSDVINGTTNRMYRRRLLQTVVDLRNLS